MFGDLRQQSRRAEARSSVHRKALAGGVFVGLLLRAGLSDLLGAAVQDQRFLYEPRASSCSLDKAQHKAQPTLS